MDQQIGVFERPRLRRPGGVVQQKTKQGNGPSGGTGDAFFQIADQALPIVNVTVIPQGRQVGEVIKQEWAVQSGPIDPQA